MYWFSGGLSIMLSRVFNLSGLVANEVSGCHILHIPQEEAGDEADGVIAGATEDEIRRSVRELE
ncbi:hypothetical protein AGMMS49545_17510 [Betaproteobacteria bacterium]|nr:hypothetical protein AGMMS49545_17510 [Betaproteobacteria bacterium]